VRDLRILVENCFDRLNSVSWLPLEKKSLIFRNASDLLSFQEELLASLESCVDQFTGEMVDNVNLKSECMHFDPSGDCSVCIDYNIPIADVFLTRVIK
jgi:hypothetical protein